MVAGVAGLPWNSYLLFSATGVAQIVRGSVYCFHPGNQTEAAQPITGRPWWGWGVKRGRLRLSGGKGNRGTETWIVARINLENKRFINGRLKKFAQMFPSAEP
jgi:hypothetical protein